VKYTSELLSGTATLVLCWCVATLSYSLAHIPSAVAPQIVYVTNTVIREVTVPQIYTNTFMMPSIQRWWTNYTILPSMLMPEIPTNTIWTYGTPVPGDRGVR
jgi:hypothetical protein